MDEEPQPSAVQTINNNSDNEEERDEKEEDEEFYEKIEAPKFVDLTASDPFRPDDRYWFCLRVGCDQKHEEEMDPEEIYKNFVLRVMAARSPNVRLGKALYRKNCSTNVKCPLSAPAKSSRSRLSRLAMVSSISRKIVEAKGNVKKPPVKPTPMVKSKQVAAKYMTTPRNKSSLPKPKSFRSVQNPKPTNINMPEKQTVAKALVFRSPKKAISKKSSADLRTPLTKLCEGMKRLEITSQKKRVLGYTPKSSREMRCGPKKSLPVDPSRRQPSARKDKSRAYGLPHPQNCRSHEAKSSRWLKSRTKGNLAKQCSSKSKEVVVMSEDSDMDIDVKSGKGSALGCTRAVEGNRCEVHLTTVEESGDVVSVDFKEEAIIFSEIPPSTENTDPSLSDGSRSKMISLPNSEGRDLEILNGEGGSDGKRIQEEDTSKSVTNKEQSDLDHPTKDQAFEVMAGDDKENASDTDDNENALNSDDKENALASDDNRDLNRDNHQCGRKILGRQELHECSKKAARKLDKNLKGGFSSTANGALEEVKYRKPKPTNPKPFRLRTDERGILKEANLERKIRSQAPQNEPETSSRFLGRNSCRRHGNDIQKSDNGFEQSRCCIGVLDGSHRQVQKIVPKKQSRTACLRGQVGPKLAAMDSQKRVKSSQQESNCKDNNASQQSENMLRKAKLSFPERQPVRPQGIALSRKALSSCATPGRRLSLIKEDPYKSKEAAKIKKSGATEATKEVVHAGPRSLSRGRRPLTIPREPNFHNVMCHTVA